MKPILYSSFNCPHSLKAAFFLSEKNVAFQRVEVDLSAKEQKKPTYLAINPRGTVPAFEDAQRVIGDSLEIMRYIDNIGDGSPLIPDDALTCEVALHWVERGDTDFWDVSHHLYWQLIEPPAEGTDWDEVARLKAKGIALLLELEIILSTQAYICGEFSIADIALLPWIYGYQRFDLPENGQFPALERWRDELSQRKTFMSNYRQRGMPLQAFLQARAATSAE